MFEELNDSDIPYIDMYQNDVVEKIEELNEKLIKDALTNTYNRRYLEEKMQMLILNYLINNKYMSIALADIDYFKKVNDTYGHIAGDNVLKGFAETLKETGVEKTKHIIRYGGEEFLIILPDLTSSEALELIDNIRKNYELKELKFDNTIIKSTASFGIVTVHGGLHKNNEGILERLIKHADDNLYKAKNNGRNCCVASDILTS